MDVWEAAGLVCKKTGHTVSTSRKESETVPGDQFLFSAREVGDPSPLDCVAHI